MLLLLNEQAEIMEVAGPHGARGSGGAGRVGTGVGTGLGGLGTFLKRGPLPREGARHGAGAALPGQARLEAGEAYGPQDLRLGALLPVLGRNLYLYDCDDATRRWYQVSAAGQAAGGNAELCFATS